MEGLNIYLTTEEKIDLLRKVKRTIETASTPRFASAICDALRDEMPFGRYQDTRYIQKEFRLNRFMPDNVQSHEAWWPFDATGQAKRVEVLTELIKQFELETKTKANDSFTRP